MSDAQRRVISGWGRTSPITATVAQPDLTDAVSSIVKDSDRVVARGLGRSYGDAAQLGGGLTLDITHLDRIIGFDPNTGIVDVEGGVSLDHLIRTLTPQGWFVPVTPGTRYVTVGGAIASDVHGKNHHAVGSFGQHVLELTLVTADGSLRTVSPESDADVFWATVGGMGLTGVILRAKVQMHAIETAKIMATTQRSGDLDALMSDMSALDANVPFSVAWVDTTARGKRFGRGLISHGDFAKRDELPANVEPLSLGLPETVEVPMDFPAITLNRLTVAAFNELWFRKAPKHAAPMLTSLADFFHPLDMVGKWNRIYGRPGFVQYQFVVPDSGSDLVAEAIRAIAATGGTSFLTVLKRFGPGNSAPMSFPIEGWTLALDIPARIDGLERVLDKLDEKVAEAGGRIYLSKDARLRPDLLATMYPRLDEWQQTRRALDPNGTFTSDLANRLGI